MAGVKDPVCGMVIDSDKAAGTSEFQGRSYFFARVGAKPASMPSPPGMQACPGMTSEKREASGKTRRRAAL